MSIYTLPQEVEQALNLFFSCFDESTWELIVEESVMEERQKVLEELQNQTSDITEWYLKDRANKLAYIAGIESEIERLSKIVSSEKKKVARSENLLERIFARIYEGKPMVIGSFKLSYRSSEAVVIENEALLPRKFFRVIPKKFEPDKVAIKDAIKAKKKVRWASIETRQNFSIK